MSELFWSTATLLRKFELRYVFFVPMLWNVRYPFITAIMYVRFLFTMNWRDAQGFM